MHHERQIGMSSKSGKREYQTTYTNVLHLSMQKCVHMFVGEPVYLFNNAYFDKELYFLLAAYFLIA